MQCHSRFIVAIGAILASGFVGSVYADPAGGSYTNAPNDLYTSPDSFGIAIPSGGINPGPSHKDYKPGVTSTPADAPANPENMLGCGGVGQGEYTSALFNMPESYGKFQKDVNSILAKQILAMNYIMPQTAALFDQLNNYGDQRYQIFQQGCNLDSLRKSAKDQYLNACVAKIQPDRKKIIQTGGNPSGSASQGSPPYLQGMSDEQINSWAYAQAWEICSNQYVSDTTAMAMRKEMNENFAKEVRRVENVTKAITPLLCPFNMDGQNEFSKGCWAELLIPQVRVCLDGAFECDSKEGAYTVTEPLLGMQRLFDAMRYVMDEQVMARRVSPYMAKLYVALPKDTVVQAGREAALSTAYGTLFRMSQGGQGVVSKTQFSSPANVEAVDVSTQAFQLGYLNCKDPDMFMPLRTLRDSVNKEVDRMTTSKKPQKPELAEFKRANVTEFVQQMKLMDGDGNELDNSKQEGKMAIDALGSVMWASLGCSANQTVPLFDPNIVASMTTQCMAPDRYAFYSMAGHDVSLAATRDIYRFLNYRLKQVYSQLLVDARVPKTVVSGTSAGGSGSTSPTINPELNNRLAVVVKETMIPYVENQLARLDEVQKSRGQFAQRVQQIYANKSGCMYGTGPGAPSAR